MPHWVPDEADTSTIRLLPVSAIYMSPAEENVIADGMSSSVDGDPTELFAATPFPDTPHEPDVLPATV